MNRDQVISSIDLLDSELADHIRQVKDEAVLRLFAGKCAALALAYCGSGDRRLSMAVAVCRRYAQGRASRPELKAAHDTAGRAAREADAAAAATKDAFEASSVPASEYIRAFGAARAASSARACCQEPALSAASEAAYEAWAALRSAAEKGVLTPDGRLPPEVPERVIDAGIAAALKAILADFGF